MCEAREKGEAEHSPKMPTRGKPRGGHHLPMVVTGTLLVTEATATATQAGELAPSDPPDATEPPPTSAYCFLRGPESRRTAQTSAPSLRDGEAQAGYPEISGPRGEPGGLG